MTKGNFRKHVAFTIIPNWLVLFLSVPILFQSRVQEDGIPTIFDHRRKHVIFDEEGTPTTIERRGPYLKLENNEQSKYIE